MALDEWNELREVPLSRSGPRVDVRVGRQAWRHSPRRVSCSVMGHWGEVIQGPVVVDGQPQIGLVTLPDPTRWVTAFAGGRHAGATTCSQPGKSKALRAARLVMERWAPGFGVQIDLLSNIPEGVGAGSSTADCAATIGAIHGLLAVPRAADMDVLAVIAAAEGPCDPLILLDGKATLLWGSRCGRLLKRYAVPLPPFHAVGFVTDPGRTVSTVELAARQRRQPPTAREVDAFGAILRDFEEALASRSADGIAAAAQASGSLNQPRCPIDGWDALARLSDAVGARGVSCAHSGTAAALLFDPGIDHLAERCERATRHLRELRVGHVHQFRTDAAPAFSSAPLRAAVLP